MRAIKAANASEMVKYHVPRTAQNTLPVQTVHEDGIFEIGHFFDKVKRFSMCYYFSDINYFSLSENEQETLSLMYGEFLNSFDTNASFKITIVNHYVNQLDFETNVLLPQRQDALQPLRNEYNCMLQSKIDQNGRITQDKYITVSVMRKNVDEARSFFQRVGAEIKTHLGELRSFVRPLDAYDRLRLVHDFMRPGEEMFYDFDIRTSARRGHSWKDYVCPDGMEIRADHLRIGEKWARSMYLTEYPTYMSKNLIAKLTEIKKQLIMSIDILPVETQEAIQFVQRVLLGINTNIVNYNKRQVKDQTFTSIPYALQQQKEEATIVFKALTEHDERMFFGLVTLTHVADSKEELDADTDTFLAITRANMYQFSKPIFRQLDTLNTALPYGVRRMPDMRMMTTISAASFIPFRSPRLQDKGGIYYGSNPLTKEMILCDRKRLLNSNGFIFGKSGGGKSFAGKGEVEAVAFSTQDDIFILDPEREYGALVEALGGKVIRISASSENHINALDFNANYDDSANPVVSKTEFVLSLCADILKGIGDKDRSLLDRCIGLVLRKYVASGYAGNVPTLADIHSTLLSQPEPEAKDLALRLEVFVNGSLDTFAKQTNVDMTSRILCFDLKDLGSQLMTLGMLIVLDAIINRVSKNKAQGRHTWVYVDEFHVFTANEYARRFFISFWKRARKYGAIMTGLTQNVGDLLNREDTHDIISNSEFLVLLSQSSHDRDKFAEMFQLSTNQVENINESGVGRGLLKCGNDLLPFENVFPKDTTLYKLMSTKLNEQ